MIFHSHVNLPEGKQTTTWLVCWTPEYLVVPIFCCPLQCFQICSFLDFKWSNIIWENLSIIIYHVFHQSCHMFSSEDIIPMWGAKLLAKRRQDSQAWDRRLCAMFEPQLYSTRERRPSTYLIEIVSLHGCTFMDHTNVCVYIVNICTYMSCEM